MPTIESVRRLAVSVIIPTYNPRLDLLDDTLGALARQTLPPLEFEIVIVDNNSGPALDRTALRSADLNDLRIVREPRQGLVHARIAGAAAARADLLVFVDDDNLLDPDYLTQAVRIAGEEPSIGCFGGVARPVAEGTIAEWKISLLGYLGTRDYGGEPVTSFKNHWGEWEPIGAGMVCRRTVAEEFAAWVKRAPLAGRLGRSGGQWMSGEDTLMAMAAYRLGYACSYQPALKLSHRIKRQRLGVAVLARILEGHGRSAVVLARLKGRPVARRTLPGACQALRRQYKILIARDGFRAGTLEWFRELGYQLESRRQRSVNDGMEGRAAWMRRFAGHPLKALRRSGAAPRKLAQNGVRRETVSTPDDGARRTLCACKKSIAEVEWAAGGWREVPGAGAQQRRQIEELRRVAEERLMALREVSAEAEKRSAAQREMTAALAARDRLIAELQRVAEERLEALRHVSAAAEERRHGMEELTAGVHQRDRRIAELECLRGPVASLPRISMVVPNLNSGATLERAIRSLEAQAYPNLQLILADGGSTDDSLEIIERRRYAFDTVLCRKDRGPADGLNHGFRYANGEIFGWLAADDELLPGALHHVARLFQLSPQADVAIGGCQRVYEDQSSVTGAPPPEAWSIVGMKNCVEQPSVFWRAALHHAAGPLDTTFELAFDWDFWCRMKAAGARVLTTNRTLSRYHFSGGNRTSRGGRKHMEEQFRILRKYGTLRAGLPYLFRFLYLHFDLKGVYDSPPACSRARIALFRATRMALRLTIGKRLLSLYNWQFASCQERGMKWW
ncbi:MAG: glycosyltransferase [Bryobacteraceae bacterium]